MTLAEWLGFFARLIVKKEKDRLRLCHWAGVWGLLSAMLAAWLRRRSNRLLRMLSLLPFLDALAAAILYALYWRYLHRPQPAPEQRTLFAGVTYRREVRQSPRPLVIHVIAVDLKTPGLRLLVTPSQPTGGRMMPARKPTTFIAEFGAQLAVNAGFFTPSWWDHWWDYYPREGQPLDVYGFTASAGHIYAKAAGDYPTLYIARDNRVTFDAPAGDIYNAISGSQRLLVDGAGQGAASVDAYLHAIHPRAAIALDETGQTLYLVVVDGRQPHYSEGVSLPELAALIRELGGYNAINLDGGGSTALAIEGPDGKPVLLNSPVDGWIPGRERPVANHLGLFAGRAEKG